MEPIDLLREMIPEHQIVAESKRLHYIQFGRSFIWIRVDGTEVEVMGYTNRMEHPDFVAWFQETVREVIKRLALHTGC